MENEIPLINDLKETFTNFEISDYFDSEIIKMHNNFINNNFQEYTNEQIYNYIKLINITCMDTKHYKNVVNYINMNNIKYFLELFYNYDIFLELCHLLSYEIASCHPKFDIFKEIWLANNFDKLPLYYDEFKPYLIYNAQYNKYYIINNKVFCRYNLTNMEYELNLIYLNKILKMNILL